MIKESNFYRKINRSVSWKQVFSFNILLLLVVVLPLSIKLVQKRSLDTGSSAAVETPTPTPLPSYPKEKPVIERVKLFFGRPDDVVVVMGKNFGEYMWEKSSLWIGEKKVGKNELVRWSNRIIEAKIPKGARRGRVRIKINGKEAVWEGIYQVIQGEIETMVGLRKISQSLGKFFVKGGPVTKGMVVLGYSGSNLQVEGINGVELEEVKREIDSFGNKVKIRFKAKEGVQGSILRIKGATGKVELLDSRLYFRDRFIPVGAILPEISVDF